MPTDDSAAIDPYEHPLHNQARVHRLHALGFFGAHVIGVELAVLIVVLLDGSAWGWVLGVGAFLISAIPLVTAVLLWRYGAKMRARVRKHHAHRLWDPRSRADKPVRDLVLPSISFDDEGYSAPQHRRGGSQA